MRNDWKNRVFAGSVALMMAVVLAGTCGYQQSLLEVYAEEETVEEVETLTEAAEEALDEDSGEAEVPDDFEEDTVGVFKEETVYVKADPSGKVTDTTVTEWLKNPEKGELADETSLDDIKNIKGEEKYTQGTGNALYWQSEGNDIYYQGTTDKELPVNISISYKLDGKEISPEELNGKDGKVEIHIDYENLSKKTVNVNGEQTELYTPFTVVTALMMSTDEYTNITVDNGKIMSDADKNIVVGIAFPGLSEDLKLDEVEDMDIDIPESVTITADAKGAAVGTTVTIVSAELMEEFDLDEIDSFDDLADAIDELEDAAGQLADGSEELADGAGELADGADALADGAGTLADGVNTLNCKSGDLMSGVNTLADGVGVYVDGVGSLADGSKELANGASALNAGIQSAQNGIAAAESGADQLTAAYKGDSGVAAVAESISNGLSQVDQALAKEETVSVSLTEAQEDSIRYLAKQMAESAANSILEANPNAFGEGDTAEQAKTAYISGLSDGYYKVLAEQFASTASTAANLAAAATKQTIRENIAPLVKGSAQLSAGIGELADGTEELQEGLKELVVGSAVLVKGSKELFSGTQSLQQGAATLDQSGSQLTAGTSELQNGGRQLKEGVGQLAEGAGQVAGGADTLADGSHQLADGSQELAEGAEEFKTEGIDKLAEVFDDDINALISRIEAMADLGKEYKSFAGIRNDMNGSTRFIIETVGVDE